MMEAKSKAGAIVAWADWVDRYYDGVESWNGVRAWDELVDIIDYIGEDQERWPQILEESMGFIKESDEFFEFKGLEEFENFKVDEIVKFQPY